MLWLTSSSISLYMTVLNQFAVKSRYGQKCTTLIPGHLIVTIITHFPSNHLIEQSTNCLGTFKKQENWRFQNYLIYLTWILKMLMQHHHFDLKVMIWLTSLYMLIMSHFVLWADNNITITYIFFNDVWCSCFQRFPQYLFHPEKCILLLNFHNVETTHIQTNFMFSGITLFLANLLPTTSVL